MSAWGGLLLSYVASALWQLPLVALATWVASRCVRSLGAQAEHRVWCVALWGGVALPALSRPVLSWVAALLHAGWMACLAVLRGGSSSAASSVHIELSDGTVLHGAALGGDVLRVVLLAYAVVTLASVARLLAAAWGVHRLRQEAVTIEAEEADESTAQLLASWRSLQARFALPRVELALSAAIDGPVTIGHWRPLVLVPVCWLAAVMEEDMQAALAHECAHVARKDFRNNLLLRWVALPLAWHPALWLVQSRIAETREMICDERAAELVAGGGRYARSLLRLAATLLDGPRSTNLYAIGVFDANQLERRMMRVTEKKQRVSRWVRRAATAAVVVLGVSVCGAAMALHTSVAVQATAAASGAQSGALVVRPDVMAGQVLSRVNPVYPADAKKARVQGTVVLEAVVGKDGSISELKALSGPKELQESALDAVKQWRYKPYLLNGEPVEVDTKITVTYSLNK